MRDRDQWYRRKEIQAVRREGQRVDQGRCCRTWVRELPCPDCFVRGGDE